ncbi:MAG: Phytoene synthase [Alphaproteobacteria bacterium MarineAlpha11_Bin1]|nr:MAG: Phytoene synthase [Alphaproteobacteria bacterium MarineAlpha11_Bin1]|tara:strand:+ start:1390 stop:2265 length:876 start_codon:yes stop_codon:yes gene_type:complete
MANRGTANDPSLTARLYVREVTRAAGSSFYWGMRLLPEPKRDAIFAVYAFCREVDDIADSDMTIAEKRARLDQWRQNIDALYTPISAAPKSHLLRALAQAISIYNLEKDDFFEIIAGMEMDTDGSMLMPSCALLQLYCERVAGAVGLLSIKIFGDYGNPARSFAITLGTALQLTNILRDVKDDALMGRLYLPREQLDLHGVSIVRPNDILSHPNLPELCDSLARRAQEKYSEAEKMLARSNAQALKPAVVMMMSYRRILDRLIAGRWQNLDDDASLSKARKLWITLRYGVM